MRSKPSAALFVPAVSPGTDLEYVNCQIHKAGLERLKNRAHQPLLGKDVTGARGSN